MKPTTHAEDNAHRKSLETRRKASRREQMESLCADICHQLHHHEVQHWKDAAGTDRERMARALESARELYSIIRNGLDVTT